TSITAISCRTWIGSRTCFASSTTTSAVAGCLGHSFGTLLALEYALAHPDRVGSLILMSPGPASHADFELLREERLRLWPADMAERAAVAATAAYQAGEPDAVAAGYGIHFRHALARREDHARLMATLRASFTREGILLARAIEDRLMAETWLAPSYDLHPRLARLAIPTLVLCGDHDVIFAECAAYRA